MPQNGSKEHKHTTNDPLQGNDNLNIDQYLEQFHADFDPVYNMLMDYQCAVMAVEKNSIF